MAAQPVYDAQETRKSEYRSHGRAVRPRDAATLIIVRQGGREPRVLLGKRAASQHTDPHDARHGLGQERDGAALGDIGGVRPAHAHAGHAND